MDGTQRDGSLQIQFFPLYSLEICRTEFGALK